MHLAILGATGWIGRHTVDEADRRGHTVTAAMRRPASLSELPDGVHGVVADATDPAQVRELAADHDAVVTAARPPDGQEAALAALTRSVLDGVSGTGARLFVVGGAATLRVPGTDHRVLDDPRYVQASFAAIAEACVGQLDACQQADDALDWVYLSPPAQLVPGDGTGRYRVGRDELVADDDGTSSLPVADLAVAVLDELEHPRHRNVRFTVGA